MKELYKKVHQMDFDGKRYNIKLIENFSQDLDGRVQEASGFAQKCAVNIYRRLIREKDVFFEIEGLEKNPKLIPVTGGFYLGMIFDREGNYQDGRHIDSEIGGGNFIPDIFFERYGKLVTELARNLPIAISERIKDFYALANEEFVVRQVENEFDRKEWLEFISKLGVFN